MKKILIALALPLALPFAAAAADYDDANHFGADIAAAAGIPKDVAASATASSAAASASREFPGYRTSSGQVRFGYRGSSGGYGSKGGYWTSWGDWNRDWRGRSYFGTDGYYDTYGERLPNGQFRSPGFRRDGQHYWYVFGGYVTSSGSMPSNFLQRVINAAGSGDVIYVGPGIYPPISTQNKNITILSTHGYGSTIIWSKSGAPCVNAGGSGKRNTKIQGFSLYEGGHGVIGGTVSECYIAGGHTTGHGGGAVGASLTDCILDANTAGGNGGGAYQCTLNRCRIQWNEASNGAGIFGGTAYNCLLIENDADVAGGGAMNATLVNCTVVTNEAKYAGGVQGCTVKNSIVSGNSARLANKNHRASSFLSSCTFPVPAGRGNFNANPVFADPRNCNFHLTSASPCRDKGDSSLVSSPYDCACLPRKLGKAVDVGCYEYPAGLTPLPPIDYDGDICPDLVFYNPATGVWFIHETEADTVRRVKLGFAGVKLVPMDHDGDGVTDPAIYNPASGVWQILHSYSGNLAVVRHGWKGIDLVQAADVDGDGKSDLVFCNPANGIWQVKKSSNGATQVIRWRGWKGITLACGDYDGDGKADLAFYAPSSFRWYIRRSSDGQEAVISLGQAGAKPVPGDYNFDGRVEAAVFVPSTGQWKSKALGSSTVATIQCGDKQSIPVPCDWDNDGVPDGRTVYNPFRAYWMNRYRYPSSSYYYNLPVPF
jgi:hypothetical protein